jgi:hypothetical protein
MLRIPSYNIYLSVLAAFCIAFTQTRVIGLFENSPIFLILFVLILLLIRSQSYIDKTFFHIGLFGFIIAIFFTLFFTPSKAILIPLGLIVASSFKEITHRLNLKVFSYSFLLIQISIIGTHTLIEPLLPVRGYYSIGTYSGSYAEPSYLAITVVLTNVLYHSWRYFLGSVTLILMSGSFFGLILMVLVGLRYLNGYRVWLLCFSASCVLVLFIDANDFRSLERLLLLINSGSIYTYAIIDQSTSFRFLALGYNGWSAVQNGLILPYNTIEIFDLAKFLNSFYGDAFYTVLKNTVLYDGHTASSMAGYALQYSFIYFLIITIPIFRCISNISHINKILILSIFCLQSFAFDLVFWFILMAVREHENRR